MLEKLNPIKDRGSYIMKDIVMFIPILFVGLVTLLIRSMNQ
jgi:hypothetical protein